MQKIHIICYLIFQHIKYLGRLIFKKQKTVIKIEIPGIKYSLTLRLFSSDVYILLRIFVLCREYDINLRITPNFIIDGGAHVGFASVWFANMFPRAKIVAIEPQKTNFYFLKKNTRFYPNITLINAALWNHRAKLEIKEPKFGHGNAAYTVEESNVSNFIQSITIKDILRRFQQDTVDILKLDIEGAEKELFSDCSEWLGRIKVLIIELHDFLKKGCKNSFNQATKGYNFKRIKGGDHVILFNRDFINEE